MSEIRRRVRGLMARPARSFASSRGASLVEYALLVGLIAVVCIGAIAFIGTATEPAFTDVSDGFNQTNQN